MAPFPLATPTPHSWRPAVSTLGRPPLTSRRCARLEGPGPPRWCGLGRGRAGTRGQDGESRETLRQNPQLTFWNNECAEPFMAGRVRGQAWAWRKGRRLEPLAALWGGPSGWTQGQVGRERGCRSQGQQTSPALPE